MPILRNAKKALQVSKRKAKVNTPVRSRLKTAVDAAKKKAEPSNLSNAFSAIDKAVKRHIIHRKKAARMKSQLAKKASSPAESAPKAAPKAKAKAAKAKTAKKTTKK
ncbi:30S ribosomal protein S20 [Patescibacteria group bacterium]|nr:30S ribosomal protein S20 [Patescibacteria group bacterium]